MSLSDAILALATRAGQECKKLHAEIGTLSSLKTSAKESVVAAVNSLYDTVATALSNIQGLIDDTTPSEDHTYSSSKIASEILAACNKVKSDLLDGADEAYDTLKELGELIKTNKSAIDALEALAAGHVKYDGAQTLTDEQKGTARSNIGAASASELTTLSGTVSQFKTDVGDTNADFVTAFETALTASA